MSERNSFGHSTLLVIALKIMLEKGGGGYFKVYLLLGWMAWIKIAHM